MDVIPMEKSSEPQATNTAMQTVEKRLDTFINWPSSDIITPESLAKAGFYYLHMEDRVQCAYCLNVFHNWVKGDTAMEEHRRLFPNCSFVKSNQDRSKCTVCKDSLIEMLYFPCLHIACCQSCSFNTTHCIVCRQRIQSRLKVHLA